MREYLLGCYPGVSDCSATPTDNERWSAVAWPSGFGVGREDNVDDPEARGVMESQQKHDQQHRAEVHGGPHVSLKQLCRWKALGLGLNEAGGGSLKHSVYRENDQSIIYQPTHHSHADKRTQARYRQGQIKRVGYLMPY